MENAFEDTPTFHNSTTSSRKMRDNTIQTMTRENWEVAHEVSGELQAELLRGLLDAQGVPARLSQEGAGRAYGINVGRLGQVQILVPTSHLDRARSIINDYYAGVFEEEDDSD
jgi:hypothetical protein